MIPFICPFVQHVSRNRWSSLLGPQFSSLRQLRFLVPTHSVVASLGTNNNCSPSGSVIIGVHRPSRWRDRGRVALDMSHGGHEFPYNYWYDLEVGPHRDSRYHHASDGHEVKAEYGRKNEREPARRHSQLPDSHTDYTSTDARETNMTRPRP